MPNPHDKKDLHFKGKHIDKFLSKYECYVDCAHLTEVQRCEDLHFYFSKQEKWVLDILKGYQNRNWSQLIKELLLLYTSLSKSYAIALSEEKSRWKDPRSEFEDLRVTGSPAFEPQSDPIPELASLPSLQVVMSDSSALPQAEGEGGIAHVIHECEACHTSTPVHTSEFSPTNSEVDGATPDFELVNLSPTESPILSVEHKMELEDLAPGFEVYYNSFNDSGMSPMTYSSTYDYMIGIDDFMSNDNVYQYCDGISKP